MKIKIYPEAQTALRSSMPGIRDYVQLPTNSFFLLSGQIFHHVAADQKAKFIMVLINPLSLFASSFDKGPPCLDPGALHKPEVRRNISRFRRSFRRNSNIEVNSRPHRRRFVNFKFLSSPL